MTPPTDGTAGTTEPPARPLLHVVRGTPSPEELAALTAVLATRSAGCEDAEANPPPLWSEPVLRSALHPGPGAWRASALPR